MRLSKTAVFLFAIITLALVGGCSNKKNQPRLEPFQEPVQPFPYPKDQGARELTRLWKKSIDVDKENTYSRLMPAVSDNQVVVASNKGEVTSYDAQSGKRLWRTALAEPVYAGVQVENGLVTLALENGEVVLLNADNGKVIWKQASGRQVAATPAISDESVIVRTADGLLLALDVKSGALQWQQQLKVAPTSIVGTPMPVVINNVVLVGMADGGLTAISSKDGSVFWLEQIGQQSRPRQQFSGVYAPPLVAGNIVVASNFGQQLAAFRLQSGEQIWRLALSTYQPMHMAEEFLFITDELGAVSAIDAKNSRLIWQQGAFKGRGVSYPAIVGNRVVIGDNQGKLHLLDIVTGSLQQTLDVANGPIRHIQVIDQQIIVFTSHGELLLYNWQIPQDDNVEVKQVDLDNAPDSSDVSASY